MAKVAYIPFNQTMAALFEALGIEISTDDFGGVTGWGQSDYTNARAAAWDALFALDEFEFDGDPLTDDWDLAADLIQGPYTVMYWSTDSGHFPD